MPRATCHVRQTEMGGLVLAAVLWPVRGVSIGLSLALDN